MGVDAPLWSLPEEQLLDLLPRLHALVARLQGGLLLPVVEQARQTGAAEQVGAPGIRRYVADKLRVGNGPAKGLVDLARKLGRDLPTTAKTFMAGEISQPHVRAISRAVDRIPDQLGTDVTTRLGSVETEAIKKQAEAFLADHARSLTPAETATLGQAVLEHVAPEIAEEIERRRLEDAEKEAQQVRSFRGTREGDRVRVDGSLDLEGWATVSAALGPLARRQPAGPDGEPDTRGKDRRMADALVELCRRTLESGTLPDQGGVPPQLTVTIDWHQLRTGLGAAVLPDGTKLSAAVARRLACEAGILPAVLGGAGQVLDLGRTRRLFTGPVRKALEIRDQGCAFPHACDTPAAHCVAHHTTPWDHGGTTSIDTGVLICTEAHWLVHHTDWARRLAPDGLPEWTPPKWLDHEQKPRCHRPCNARARDAAQHDVAVPFQPGRDVGESFGDRGGPATSDLRPRPLRQPRNQILDRTCGTAQKMWDGDLEPTGAFPTPALPSARRLPDLQCKSSLTYTVRSAGDTRGRSGT